ncbi:Uma2 family endonuclease [Dactylosporangium sp. NPDC051485]|uniref:Uma2 family endonuclease n=1 Tax=Dactylosporangium sp. NPDC051485 TaxID=3154846 RepID=UPI003425F545
MYLYMACLWCPYHFGSGGSTCPFDQCHLGGDLLLVIEIVSRGSEAIDQGAKVPEYAAAGIGQYWMVARDAAQTLTLHRLGSDGTYEVTAKMPLAWLLQTAPADHIGG